MRFRLDQGAPVLGCTALAVLSSFRGVLYSAEQLAIAEAAAPATGAPRPGQSLLLRALSGIFLNASRVRAPCPGAPRAGGSRSPGNQRPGLLGRAISGKFSIASRVRAGSLSWRAVRRSRQLEASPPSLRLGSRQTLSLQHQTSSSPAPCPGAPRPGCRRLAAREQYNIGGVASNPSRRVSKKGVWTLSGGQR